MTETPGWSSPDQQPNQPQQPPGQPEQQQPGYYSQGPPQQPVNIKPGVIPLRPLSLTEILDGAISTMRRHPKLILGASAIVAAVTQIVGLLVQLPLLKDVGDLSAAVQQGTMSQQELRDAAQNTIVNAITSGGLALILLLIGTVFLSGYITVIVGHAVLGRPVTFGQAWEEFKPRLLPLLGATLLFGLIVTVGLFLCLVPGIWLWVLFGLLTPALVLERCGVFAAFGRSKNLVNGAWWRTFGILLVTVLISIILNLVLSLPFELAGSAITGFSTDPMAALDPVVLMLGTIGAIIASTITLPFSAAVTVLIYVDRRMRVEGMDIELQRAAGHGGI